MARPPIYLPKIEDLPILKIGHFWPIFHRLSVADENRPKIDQKMVDFYRFTIEETAEKIDENHRPMTRLRR